MAFRGVDYFCVDSLFSEQELMVRQTARRFADERILPLIRDCFRDARFPTELIPEMARARLPRRQPGRLRLRRHEQRRVRADHAGTGARRFRPAQLRLACRARWSCTRSSPTAREEQKQRWLPRLQSGQGDRLLRPHRAGFRLESRRACAPPRGATAIAGSSTARRPGSPTARWPMSRWSGRAPTRASRIPGRDAARRASPRPTFTASGRCGRR